MAAHGLSIDWYVHRHRDRGRGAAVGAHLGRPARGLPLAGVAGRPGGVGHAGLPLDAVLRLRGLHRLRPRARGRLAGAAGRRQPGHRPGSGAGHRGAGLRCGRPPAWGPGREDPDPVRQAGQDSLDQSPGRGPHVGAGVSPGAVAGGLHRRLLPSSQGQLRAGPAHRPRVRGRIPGCRAGRGCRRVDVRTLPAPAVRRRCRRASTSRPSEPIAPGTPSLQEDVDVLHVAVAGRSDRRFRPARVAGCWAERLRVRVDAVLAASSVVVTRTRKGEELTDDIRAGI